MSLIKYFWNNSIKPQWGLRRFIKHYFICPAILFSICFLLKKFWRRDQIFDIEGWKDLINMFAIVSWFLLTWLSVILSNTNIKKDKIDEIKEKYKLHIMEYGKWDVNSWLSKFKLSILLETVLLIGICILLAIIVTVFESNYFSTYLTAYLIIILFLGLFTLIKQILVYLNIVEFDSK